MSVEIIRGVPRCGPSDLTSFGVSVRPYRDDLTQLLFEVSDGVIWKSAGAMFVYDDGRILVNYYKHLTAGELEVVYGLAERAFKGGAQACRREHWQRVRKSKARPVGYYRLPFMVRADQGGSFASIIAAAAMPDVDRDLEMLVGSEG